MKLSGVAVNPTRTFIFCIGVAVYLYFSRSRKRYIRDSPESVEPEIEASRLLVVTRVHNKSASQLAEPVKIVQFVRHVKTYCSSILICLGSEDRSFLKRYIMDVEQELSDANIRDGVEFLVVEPWGYYVPALNSAVTYAQDHGFNRIAFQSLEFRISEYEVGRILRRLAMNKNTIVAGPELQGHEFSEATHTLRGRTCPWNTFAVWKVSVLGLTGFPLIGDGLAHDRSMGGVEELSAITLLQLINPKYEAILMRIVPRLAPGTSSSSSSSSSAAENEGRHHWNTTFSDPQRREYHARKMLSKDERPAVQMEALGIQPGRVRHLIDRY